MRQIRVKSGEAGGRLDLFLAQKLGWPRHQIQRLIEEGLVEVDGEPAKASHPIEAGEQITVHSRPGVTAPALPVVYESKDLLVIDKPANLLSHSVSEAKLEPSVAAFAASKVKDSDRLRPGLVHRLDKDTSGLMLIAKNPKSKEYLKSLFRKGAVDKTYLALIKGHIEPAQALVKLPLLSVKGTMKRRVGRGGQPAVSKYRVIQYLPGFTLVEAKPETGRTHQLRAHFAYLKHPVAGDTLYGSANRPLGLKRQFLHAARLGFIAPGGQKLLLKSELPEDLAGFLEHLQKEYDN